MGELALKTLQTINELLSAGISITAASLLLYALSFNLRDRVARSFAIILMCVAVVFTSDTISSAASSDLLMEFWLRFQWIGIAFLPAAYLHFSDALLATTGRPSRGLRRWIPRLLYLVSLGFLLLLPAGLLVGPLETGRQPAPHLERTWLTYIFTFYYAVAMLWAWLNFRLAYYRTKTSVGRRRMKYLVLGALAPALGSYPFLLFGSRLAAGHPYLFWGAAIFSNLAVYGLLIMMAYSVAYFGVSWPDRVVKRRLLKWLMRGPVAASIVLGITTIVRRVGDEMGVPYSAAVPLAMVASILVIEHIITLLAPWVERLVIQGGEQGNMQLHTLEERLVTLSDLRQFLESVLAAVCDRAQVDSGFLVVLGAKGLEMVVTVGENKLLGQDLSDELLQLIDTNGFGNELFIWGSYWLVPLYGPAGEDERKVIGLIGLYRSDRSAMDAEHHQAIESLAERAALAIEDRARQQQAITSLQAISPQMELIQRVRAASRYDGSSVLADLDGLSEEGDLSRWVKDALSHYWGGPKLTESPLLQLQVVKQALADNENNPVKALRSILAEAIERIRPPGERRFTGEWILYNILEMKFIEGRKVREIAIRLAMSEADLYRKQRFAIEAVATTITDMEKRARDEPSESNTPETLVENDELM
jgi:hypothetical protein